MSLPEKYAWLAAEAGPRQLKEALKLYGVREELGQRNNPTILDWAEELGGRVEDVYDADSIPWCGLFAGIAIKRGGFEPPTNMLWALSWSAFGAPVARAMLGDVLVFTRPGGGHVGFYVAEDDDFYHVLGGNQQDAVNVTRVARGRLYAKRRPNYATAPGNIRQIYMTAEGFVSENEQ